MANVYINYISKVTFLTLNIYNIQHFLSVCDCVEFRWIAMNCIPLPVFQIPHPVVAEPIHFQFKFLNQIEANSKILNFAQAWFPCTPDGAGDPNVLKVACMPYYSVWSWKVPVYGIV